MAFTFNEDYKQDTFTADAVIAEADNQSKLEEQRAAEATAAGVQDARFIGYAEVLEVYNKRSDTETLANRRARAQATDAGQQSFTRNVKWGSKDEEQTVYPDDASWAE